ncbi:alternative oxidase, mitochondrial [[Candida] anglica]|uniref:Alternative oxidase n=1 Tax=[Candida] anglica TaxID=148631 RepID=A0ABP0EG55_9ASCO
MFTCIKTAAPRSALAAMPPRAMSIRNLSLDIKTKVMKEDDIAKHDDKEFITHPIFPHPVFTTEDCEAIKPAHRPPVTFGDRVALKGINFFKGSFDLVTGYKHPNTPEELADGFKGTRYEMTPGKWLTRCIFLESVAGVPGMVAAFIRHLHSLRLLRRDKAWIETLLDEAYNERMHLLTFIKLGNPSWFTRTIIYVGQGVFCNLFFIFYLVNPRYCHRFVGYLEEEAVSTYSHFVHDLKINKFPEFDHAKVPQIAIQYWPNLNENSTILDLVLRVRADEAKHREVNHTLANLEQNKDRNPFALQIESDAPQPENGLKQHRPEGWERSDLFLDYSGQQVRHEKKH